MPNAYIVRDLNPIESKEFEQALKRAKAEGRSMRWIVVQLVTMYAKVGLDPLMAATKRAK